VPFSRREFLKAGSAFGALLIARPFGVLAETLGPASVFETPRESRLFPGTWVAHADLHNHSLHSDGEGDPALAFDSMRAAGLDVAALSDHSTLSYGLPMNVCPNSECQSLAGINEETWAHARQLADVAHVDGEFVALRAFEWSSPTLGHMNVWFSERWMDPLHTAGAGTGEGAAQFLHDEANVPAELMAPLDAIVKGAPTPPVGMALFYEWLTADPGRPLIGGGADGIAGFNHPGREPGRFSNFRLDPAVRDRIVSLEVFNRREDYIYEGTNSIAESPLNECLNAGWRVGLTGVTDEHGTDWGFPDGKGRAGLYVTELTRAGVRDALAERRFFATRLQGLRLDAAANGTRMGKALAHTSGPVTFQIDIDRGPAWIGRPLSVQVLRSGTVMPSVQEVRAFTVPGPADPLVSFTTNIDIADGDWVVLRITDPSETADDRADATYAAFGNAVAYASPFFLGA
jgi:hypothetical protein